MKRMIIALVAMFMMTFTTASAMSYEQARQQALFLDRQDGLRAQSYGRPV